MEPTPICIAAAHAQSPPRVVVTSPGCRGDLLNLTKMTSYLDLMTMKPAAKGQSGGAAMERAVIKSRLGIPFWKADEVL